MVTVLGSLFSGHCDWGDLCGHLMGKRMFMWMMSEVFK
jgi:hypothetical protein